MIRKHRAFTIISSEKIKYIQDHAYIYTVKDISEHLEENRRLVGAVVTTKKVEDELVDIGFSTDDLNFIEENFEVYTEEELAERFGVEKNIIQYVKKQLGLIPNITPKVKRNSGKVTSFLESDTIGTIYKDEIFLENSHTFNTKEMEKIFKTKTAKVLRRKKGENISIKTPKVFKLDTVVVLPIQYYEQFEEVSEQNIIIY